MTLPEIFAIILLIILGLIILGCVIVQCRNRKNMTKEQKKENPGCIKSFFVFAGVFMACGVVIISLLILFFKVNISNNDIEINYDPNISAIGIDCNVTAKINVEDVELEFTFYDYKQEKIYTLKKYVGDIEKGKTKTITVSMFEIKSEAVPITYSVKISNGKSGFFANIF